MTSRTTGAFLILAVFLLSGCSSDKIEAGRRLINTEPEKAIALFQEAEQERGDCFDCLIYTGLVYEKMGSDPHALSTYERALALPEATSRPEPVAERLLVLYEKAHGQATGTEKLRISRKAAILEKQLKVARPWASMYLLDLLTEDMKKAAEAGDENGVRTVADECMNLALPAELKNNFAVDATRAMQKAFVVRTKKQFKKKLAPTFEKEGLFDAKTEHMIMKNDFDIPSKRKNPEFDPESPRFQQAVRKGACLPLYAELEKIIKTAAPVLGLKNIDETTMNLTFQELYKKAVAGFARYGGEKRKPAGEPYRCMIDVPLKDFLSALFRFAE